MREATVRGVTPEDAPALVALLQVAPARYVEAGYAASTLDVDAGNPTGALGVYERAGYRERLRFALYELAEA
jgi:ribosomal protein S18 acetylase RimI-like enzyme